MRGKQLLLLLLVPIFFLFYNQTATAQDFPPTQTLTAPPSPADIINAINALRLSYGLNALAAHPALMQIAQEQASGIAAGLPGHWRPNGMTLGQWMLSLGYPLSGDLTLDGYRSENWGAAFSADEAVQMWLGDDLHTNTMLSVDRSDIGAGVAVGDGQFYIVIETALQTKSGQMQSNVPAILTGIPETKVAFSQIETQAAINGQLPQYSVPVLLSTSLPTGNVYHEVRYGQTLWSVAIAYHTTIKQIQGLNNLGASTTVYEGQILLVQTGATQPASTAASTETPMPSVYSLPTATLTPTKSLPSDEPSNSWRNQQGATLGLVAIGLAALVLAGVFAAMTRKKEL